MSYNKKLADRIREAFAHIPKVEERQMMGGISFMVNGKMCVRAHRNNELMLRCEPEMTDELLLKKGAKRLEMKGKNDMKGWLLISGEGIISKEDFEYWMRIAIDYNGKLNSGERKKKQQHKQ